MSDSEYEEEQPQHTEPSNGSQGAPQDLPANPRPAATQPTTQPASQSAKDTGGLGVPPPAKKNARNAGRKPGNKPGKQAISEYQQSKLIAETLKEYSEMIIGLKKDLEDHKRYTKETLGSEETMHMKDVKSALHDARVYLARSYTR